MYDLNAATRLKATQSIESDEMLEAGFDDSEERVNELKAICEHLRKAEVLFRFSQDHLYHKSNEQDIINEINHCIDVLYRLGHSLNIRPQVLKRTTFALKGPKGLVLQRLGNNLRIFFSI